MTAVRSAARSHALVVTAATLGVATLAAAVFTVDIPSGTALALAAGLVLAAILAEAFPVPIYNVSAGSTSLATIFLSTLAVVESWSAAVIAGALAMGVVEIVRRRRTQMVVYNTSLYVLAGAAAGAAALAAPGGALDGLAAPAAFYLVNIALLTAIITATRGGRYPRVLSTFFVHTAVPFLVMASLTGVLVALRDAPLSMLLLIPPLIALAAYQTWTHGLLKRRDELDRMKDEVVAVVSHELRTPLASVTGAALTLQQPNLRRDHREHLLRMMGDEAKRLNRLIDEVLWVSRSQRAQEPEIRPIDAGELARTAAEEAAALAPDGLVVHGAGWGIALGDESQVRRVLNTLLENAIKYSPDGGEVRVSAAVVGRSVRFTVADDGLGIPDEERERVFEKFHRLDPQMLRGIGGTGLGLYIARGLLERMGGRIWIEPNVSKGTQVIFELPAEGATTSNEAEEELMQANGNGFLRRVTRLVVTFVAVAAIAMVGAPKGWKWGTVPKGKAQPLAGATAPEGWSWTEARVVEVSGDEVTLASPDSSSTVTLVAPASSDPAVGDAIAVVSGDDETLLGFPKTTGETKVWVPLGWSWSD